MALPSPSLAGLCGQGDGSEGLPLSHLSAT
jgi:hypothetical protein